MKTIQETKPLKSPKNTGKIQVRSEKGQFVKGVSGNPKGKPQGSKSFSTLMDEAVKEIAKLNKISPAEVWQVLIKRGYSEAKDGNYPFFKDIFDRYYGKAMERFKHSGEIQSRVVYLPQKKNE